MFELAWKLVPLKAQRLAEACRPVKEKFCKAAAAVPRSGYIDTSYDPLQIRIWVRLEADATAEAEKLWKAAAESVVSDVAVIRGLSVPTADRAVRISIRPLAARAAEKRAGVGDTLRGIGGFDKPPGLPQLPGWPSPLSAMLASGLLGAGLGYGGGWFLEKLQPDRWQKGRTRRTLAVLGGLLGATPGALLTAYSIAKGKSPLSSEMFQPPQPEGAKLAEFIRSAADFPQPVLEDLTGYAPARKADQPLIPIEEFKQTLWNYPPVASRLSLPTQAAATGLVEGAAQLSGRTGTKFVTPVDMARMTAGMGSGYLSGLLVGKVLGALFGMPDESQASLAQKGVLAGMIANLVPLAFR